MRLQTDGRTDMVIPVYPLNFVAGDIITDRQIDRQTGRWTDDPVTKYPGPFEPGHKNHRIIQVNVYVHKHGNLVLIFPFSVCNNDGKTACSIWRNYCPHTPNNRHDYIMTLLQVQNMAKSGNDCLSMNALLELCTSDITCSSI